MTREAEAASATRGTLAAALLVLAAGCSGFAGGPATPTATPAPVPTDAASPTPGAAPPGVTADGVVDPLALANAHFERLSWTSYTLRATWTVRGADGERRAGIRQTARVAANHTRFHVVVDATGAVRSFGRTPVHAEYWSGGARLYEATTHGDDTAYEHIPAGAHRDASGFYQSLVRPTPRLNNVVLFASVATDLARSTVRNGTRVYVLTGDAFVRPAAFAAEAGVSDPRNVSFRAAVDGGGLIREYRLTYTATVAGETVRVARTVRFTRVGTTAVERPPWYETAVNASGG